MNVEFAKTTASQIGLELDIHYFDSITSEMDSNNAIIFNQYPDPELNKKTVISIGSVVVVDASISSETDTTSIFNSKN